MGNEHRYTAPYSKEENAIVERANKEVMRHLRNIIFDKDVLASWSTYLPLVQRIMNSAVHNTIGVTPAEILFGNAVQLDRQILNNTVHKDDDIKLSKWTADMLSAQAVIINTARKNLKELDEVHMLSNTEETTVFPIGSYVLAEYPENKLRRGAKSKLLPNLKGPMRVVNITNNGNTYSLQDLVTNRCKDYMVKNLRPFVMTAQLTARPIDIAVKDREDIFVVRDIIDISGNPSNKKNLLFKVLWEGYSDDEFTWEPWANVRSNVYLIKFLRNHPNKKVQALEPKNIHTQSNA